MRKRRRIPEAKELKLHSKNVKVAEELTIGKSLSKELITRKTGDFRFEYRV